MNNIPTPNKEEVEKYLKKWDSLENYVLQENALDIVHFLGQCIMFLFLV